MLPRAVTVSLAGITPYSGGAAFQSEPLEGENAEAQDIRCWRERIHTNADGQVFIPPRALKSALASIARHKGKKIKGRGNKTWGDAFERGIQPAGLPEDGLLFDAKGNPIMLNDVPMEVVYAYAQGHKSENESRVRRRFPTVPAGWTTKMRLLITDDSIDEKSFAEHLDAASLLIGLGRYRPENGGEYGLFNVKDISWEEKK